MREWQRRKFIFWPILLKQLIWEVKIFLKHWGNILLLYRYSVVSCKNILKKLIMRNLLLKVCRLHPISFIVKFFKYILYVSWFTSHFKWWRKHLAFIFFCNLLLVYLFAFIRFLENEHQKITSFLLKKAYREKTFIDLTFNCLLLYTCVMNNSLAQITTLQVKSVGLKLKTYYKNETKHKERDKIIYMNIPIINHLEESTY